MPAILAVLAAAVAAVTTATTSLAPVSIPKSWSARERAVAQVVSASGLAAHVRFLSDDLLEGRGPGTRGDELAMIEHGLQHHFIRPRTRSWSPATRRRRPS